MPRFFFHVYGNLITEDEEGVGLPDLEAAVTAAVRSLRGILADQVQGGEMDLATVIEITDAADRVLHSINFEDAVEVVRREQSTPELRLVSRS